MQNNHKPIYSLLHIFNETFIWLLMDNTIEEVEIEPSMEEINRVIQIIVISLIQNIQSRINLLNLGPIIFLLLSRHTQLLLRRQRLKHPTSLLTQLIITWLLSTFFGLKVADGWPVSFSAFILRWLILLSFHQLCFCLYSS